MSKRILIADDETELAGLMADILKTFDFWDSEPVVDLVESGTMALENMSKENYDLFITDQSMPELTGLQTIKELRSTDSSNQEIPCLLISGHISDDLMSELDSMSQVFYSEKPTPMPKLNEILQEILKI